MNKYIGELFHVQLAINGNMKRKKNRIVMEMLGDLDEFSTDKITVITDEIYKG